LQGDISANLTALAAQERAPEEEVAHKLWHLLRREYPLDALLSALQMLQEVSFTTAVVEQGHSHTSKLSRLHPGYSSIRIRGRAQIATFAKLLGHDKAAQEVERLETKAAVMDSYQPARFQGRQLYMRRLREASVNLELERGSLPKDLSQRIIRGHGRM